MNDATETPAQTPSPTVAQPQPGPLEPGRYAIPINGVTDFHADVTFQKADLSYQATWVGVLRQDPPTGLLAWHVGQVYPDPCASQSSVLPDGHSPQDLMAALAAQKGTRLSAATDTTVDGYPAIRVDLLKTPHFASRDGCRLWADQSGANRPGPDDSPMPVWIVDVNGTTVVIDVHNDTDQIDSEIQRIIDTVTFTSP